MSDDRTAHSRLLAVAVDARDPEALAEFWCAVLGSSVVDRKNDAHGTRYVDVALQPGTVLLFQQVPEDKAGKNRVHLDVVAVELDHAAEVERLRELGATVLDEAPEHPWIVMADPEGNEFCVLPPGHG